MKKFTFLSAVILSVLVGLFLHCDTAMAADEDPIWQYTVTDDKATITRYNGTDTDVVIPDTIDGYEVTALGQYVFVGEYVYLESLGKGYYKDDTTTVSLTIPASITSINLCLFTYMETLETIQVDTENTVYASLDGVLLSKDMGTLHFYPRGKKDSSYKVPDSVTDVASTAFTQNNHITALDLNHAATDHHAVIYLCEALESVDFGDSYEEITTEMIVYCENLKEITLPHTVSNLSRICESCPALETVQIEAGNSYYCSIDNIIFDTEQTTLVFCAPNRAGTEYTVPDTVTTIQYHAFYWNRSLQTVTLPVSVSSIQAEAFRGSKITDITILNENCSIYDGDRTFPSNAILHGYQPSTAYDYAADYGRTFVNLEDGSVTENVVTYESMLALLPTDTDTFGEPTYQLTDVIHESDTSSAEYTQLKAFTDSLIADCTTDLEKVTAISQWVHNHISYRLGALAGNTIDSVYYFFFSEAPTGNCMAYTRLTAYMLYLADIKTVDVVNTSHEWCMAYLDGQWWIIDATNSIITTDYSNSLHESPSFMSFSKDGNIYAVQNNRGISLTGINYGQTGGSEVTAFTIPDFVDRVSFSFSTCPRDLVVTGSSSLQRDLAKYFSCITVNGETLTARKSHTFGDWTYIGNTNIMESSCIYCHTKETLEGAVYDPIWSGKTSHVDAVGKTIDLHVRSSSDGTLTYHSSNEKVAVVSDSGIVTLTGAGSATITASVKATNKYTASEYTITVTAIDIGTPQITDCKTLWRGGTFHSIRVTISWTKVQNADCYHVCYGNTANDNYGYAIVDEDGKKTKSYTVEVCADPDRSNRFWVEAYNNEYKVTSPASEYQYYTHTSITLSNSSYTYNGQPSTPSVTVEVLGQTLRQGTDYTLSYEKNADVGTAKAVVTLMGNYAGKAFAEFTINPPKTTLSSVKNNSRKAITVKWKKNAYVSGYQIQYAAKKNFKGKKTVTINSQKTGKKKLSGLKKGKTYFVRIRTFRTVSGTKYFSGWSKKKKVVVRK